MNIHDGHIDYRGFFAITLLVTVGKVFNPSVSLLTQYAGQATWLLSLISGTCTLLIVLGLLKMMRATPHTSLLSMVRQRVGNWPAKVFGMILFICIVMDGALGLRLIVDQTKIVTLPKTPTSVMLLLVLVLSLFLCWRGIEALARMSAMWLPWVGSTLVLLAVLIWNLVDFKHLFPLLGPGVPTLAVEGVQHSLYYGEPIACMLLAPFARKQQDFERGVRNGLIVSILVCTLMILMVQLTMGSPASSSIAFPFLDMARMVYVSRFIHHLEGFFAAVWLIIALTQVAITVYLSTYLFSELFGITNFRPLLPGICCSMFLGALMPQFFYQTLEWKDIILIQGGGGLIYGFTLLLFLVGFLARKKTSPAPD